MGESEAFLFREVVSLFCCCSQLHQRGHCAKTALNRSLFSLPLSFVFLSQTFPLGKRGQLPVVAHRPRDNKQPAVGQVQNERVGVQIGSRNRKHDREESGTERKRRREQKNLTQEKEERKREEGESGRMHPGHDSRWCLKCFGGLFPLLSLLMSFLCSCVF